jgi:hypothetical protein
MIMKISSTSTTSSGTSGAIRYVSSRLPVKRTASNRPIFSPRDSCTAAMRAMAPPNSDQVARVASSTQTK